MELRGRPKRDSSKRMARYWRSLSELTAEFEAMGLSLAQPGFYDEPAFRAAEDRDPELLFSYGRFVARREYSNPYLEKARREIPFIAQQFHAALSAQGTLGACVNASMALSRILDQEGFWNFCEVGGVHIEYPASSGLKATTFQQVGAGPMTSGHGWIHAPPFRVVDITLRQQPYAGAEAQFIPSIVLAKSSPAVSADPSDVITPSSCYELSQQGIAPRAMLERVHGTWREFTRCFPPTLVEHEGTKIKYVPFKISVSDKPLSQITNQTYQGRYPSQVYQDMQPALAAFRAAASASTTP